MIAINNFERTLFKNMLINLMYDNQAFIVNIDGI